MGAWNSILTGLASLQQEVAAKLERQEGELRFHRPVANASDLAQQYFCEKKVEITYLLGKVETEQKRMGTEAHELMLEGSEPVEREALFHQIFSGAHVLALELLLLARYKNAVLCGKPDCVAFVNGAPTVLFEYKFSRSPMPFKNHHVQAGAYGVILNRMGFNTDHLSYAIAILRPDAKHKEDLRDKIVDATLRQGAKRAVIKLDEGRIYTSRFDMAEAETALDWALDFWRSKREAIPTDNPNKCRACEYFSNCKTAPTKPAP